MIKTIGKVLLSCSIYALISHIVLDVNYGEQFTALMTAARSFTIYSVLFLGYSGIPIFIAILFAKIPKENRNKPIAQYINSALLVGWLVALVFLWGGWNANLLIQNAEVDSINAKVSSKEMIEKLVKNEVEKISKQTPFAIDRHTNLVSVTFLNGSTHFLYQIHSVQLTDIDRKLFTKKIIEFSRNKFCTDPSTKLFRDSASDIVVNWKYIDSKGVVISNYSMKGAECSKQ